MTLLRNLSLAAKTGGAFGVLVLALALTGLAGATGAGDGTIFTIMSVSIVAAVAMAIWITRSVVLPVKTLGQRMTSLDDFCLTGLSGALTAVASGDLTQQVTPVTLPIEVNSSDEL